MISAKKISHTLSVNILEFASGFGVTSFVTLFFTGEEAGKWMWVMAMVAVQAKIREGITQTALVKYACNGSLKSQMGHRKINLIITLLFELAVVVVLFCISPFMGETFAKWFLVYSCYSLTTAFFRWQMLLWQGLLITHKLLKAQGTLTLLIAAVALFSSINQIDLIRFTLFLGIIRFLALLPFIDYRALSVIIKSRISVFQLQQIKNFAGFGLLRETTGSLASRAELLIGGFLLTFSEVAWIGLAARYTQLLLLPNGSIQGLVNARAHMLASKNITEMKKLLGQTLIGIWAFFIVCLIFFATTAPFWFEIIHGSSYKEALPLISTLLFANAIFAPTGGIFGTICHALNRPELTAKVVLVSSVLKLSITAFGLMLYGIWGGVISIFIVEIWGLFYTNAIMKNNLKITWHEVLKMGIQNSGSIKTAFANIR